MNETVLTTIALTGFSVAFFHAAIPTHWLPFVAAGRVQHWSHAKTLAVTALAGSGHVLTTALLGLALTLFGVAVDARLGAMFPWIAGGVLIVLGSYYLWRQWSGRGHSHIHLFPEHSGHQHESKDRHEHGHWHEHVDEEEGAHHHEDLAVGVTAGSDRLAIWSLFATLTFSPCEGFLPIYISGIRFGWSGFALLTLILSAATVAGMLVFTGLALAGMRAIRVRWFEQYESGVMGLLLVVIGMLVIVFEK
jgi:nickel/cobalt exporter